MLIFGVIANLCFLFLSFVKIIQILIVFWGFLGSILFCRDTSCGCCPDVAGLGFRREIGPKFEIGSDDSDDDDNDVDDN